MPTFLRFGAAAAMSALQLLRRPSLGSLFLLMATVGFGQGPQVPLVFPTQIGSVADVDGTLQVPVTVHNPYPEAVYCSAYAHITVVSEAGEEVLGQVFENVMIESGLAATFAGAFVPDAGSSVTSGSAGFSLSCTPDAGQDPLALCDARVQDCQRLCPPATYDEGLCAVSGKHFVYQPGDLGVLVLGADHYGFTMTLANPNTQDLSCEVTLAIRAYSGSGAAFSDVFATLPTMVVPAQTPLAIRKKIAKQTFGNRLYFDLEASRVYARCHALAEPAPTCKANLQHECNWTRIDDTTY